MRDRIADPDPRSRQRLTQRLGVGVADDEADAGDAGVDHAVHGIAATTADTDDEDRASLWVAAAPDQAGSDRRMTHGEQSGQHEDDQLEERLGGRVHALESRPRGGPAQHAIVLRYHGPFVAYGGPWRITGRPAERPEARATLAAFTAMTAEE